MDKCLGQYTLSLYLANDLSGEEQRSASAHLEGCEQCQGRLHQIEQDQAAYAEFGQAHYNVAWQRAVENRDVTQRSASRKLSSRTIRARDFAHRAKLFRPAIWKVLLPVAAVSIIAALVLPRLLLPPQSQYTGYKGTLSLQIIAKRKERQFVVSDNNQLCAGDALRFSVTAEGAKHHLVVFSLDRNNTLSTFYPNETTPSKFLASSGKTIELTGQGRHVLPGSIILDSSQGRELIFLLVAPKPFDPHPLRARIERIASKNRRAAEVLTADKLGFLGTVRVIPIVKAPCS